MCYAVQYPSEIAGNLHISQLEALDCMIAAQVFPIDKRDSCAQIVWDNLGAITSLSTGKGRDPVITAICRSFWFFSAVRNIAFVFSHAPGHEMEVADALSRHHLSSHDAEIADNIVSKYELEYDLNSANNRMGLDSSPFTTFKVRNAFLSIDKNVRDMPATAFPVTLSILRKAVRIIRRLPDGESIAAAVIFMFHTFHRQFNFSAQSAMTFDASRQITRGDVQVFPDCLEVAHKRSKSHQCSGHHAVTSIVCPGQHTLSEAGLHQMSAIKERHPATHNVLR